jgi:predicted GIY-YIG superfamily endonuclease
MSVSPPSSSKEFGTIAEVRVASSRAVTSSTARVYVEQHDRIEQAIQREALIKSWPRAWKVRLITRMNPNWDDLYDHIIG